MNNSIRHEGENAGCLLTTLEFIALLSMSFIVVCLASLAILWVVVLVEETTSTPRLYTWIQGAIALLSILLFSDLVLLRFLKSGNPYPPPWRYIIATGFLVLAAGSLAILSTMEQKTDIEKALHLSMVIEPAVIALLVYRL